jgi:hypothetical protein
MMFGFGFLMMLAVFVLPILSVLLIVGGVWGAGQANFPRFASPTQSMPPTPTARYCSHCGQGLQNDWKACPHCGAKIE